jgi:hypothetical protein
MKKFLLGLMFFFSFCTASVAATEDYSKASLERLVDDLAQIDCPAPGVDGSDNYVAFMADNAPPQFEGGLLGQPEPCMPGQMRELVRRGISALPMLIWHLSDTRPTKLIVGRSIADEGGVIFGDQYFSNEYDPRHRKKDAYCGFRKCTKKEFDNKYTVRVGDICYALVGQIVGRNLGAVEYQPTMILVVNSPIESPWLIKQVKKDWGSIDEKGLKASLMADLHDANRLRIQADAEPVALPYFYRPSLVRLRFYFPDAYANLKGADLAKRISFENDEKSHGSAN